MNSRNTLQTLHFRILPAIGILFIIVGTASAQKPAKKPQLFKAAIQLSAKAYNDSIVLRWAPDAPGAWTTGNQHGYSIERTEVPETGAFDPASYQLLNPSPLKPWPLDQWATIAGKNSNNSMAAIAAQALYGKSFTGGGANFVDMADEFANRWSFALLAADMNPPTATALGLRYTDKNIIKGKTYIYRVNCLADSSVYKIEAGYTVVNTVDIVQISKPLISKATEMEYAIQLEWDREYHEKAFSAYWIERSDDKGKTFKKLTSVPFLNPQTETRKASTVILFTDSLKENYKPYVYRLTGITSFGEQSSPSETITAMGRDKTPPAPPEKVKAQSLGGSKIKLTWEKKIQENDLKGFYIGRSNNASAGFQPLFDQPLPPTTRTWTDEKADVTTTNYYIVAAIDTAGNGNVSVISYGMIIDSVPPKPPVGIKGSIDTMGIVRITWNLGKEPDLAGYMIYFANDTRHVFSSTTEKPLRDTVFVDTITLKTLSEKIYYKIKSVDVNYNYSPFSALLELKRPDRVPPTSPVISDYKVSNDGIYLEWIPSASEDVIEHRLYRKIDKGNWAEYKKFQKVPKVSSFTDKDVKPGSEYSYRLVSIDDGGNKSIPSVEMTLKFTGNPITQAVNNIFATATADKKGILVSWNYPVQGNYRFTVYRAINGGNFQTVETTEQKVTSFTDKNVQKGVIYEYQVRVFFKDGRKSALGKIIKISL
jgi:fibronectin type 3 domain-containing protein